MIPFQDFSKRVPSSFNLYITGDIHIGSNAVSFSRMDKAIGIIEADPVGYWASVGDNIEGIFVNDPRFQLAIHARGQALFTTQIDCWIEHYLPILGKLFFILEGNHEEKFENSMGSVGNLITNIIGDRHGIGNIASGGRSITAKFSNKFKLFATHGSGVVNSRAGDAKQREVNDSITIKRKMRDVGSDCIVRVMGHIHKLRICEPVHPLSMVNDGKMKAVYAVKYESSEGVIHEDSCWFASTGSFLKGWEDGITTYAEKAMYPPVEMGIIKIVVVDGHVINVEKVIV